MNSSKASYSEAIATIEMMEAKVKSLIATVAEFHPHDDEVSDLQTRLVDVLTKVGVEKERTTARCFFRIFREDMMKRVEGPPGTLVKWRGTRSSVMNFMERWVGEVEMDAGFRRMMRWAAGKGWELVFWDDGKIEETTSLETIQEKNEDEDTAMGGTDD